jgi:hypothetical protein
MADVGTTLMQNDTLSHLVNGGNAGGTIRLMALATVLKSNKGLTMLDLDDPSSCSLVNLLNLQVTPTPNAEALQ